MLGQNQQAKAHVVPVTLNCQPRTKREINSHMQTSVKVKAFTYYWGHLSYHILRAHIAFKYIPFPFTDILSYAHTHICPDLYGCPLYATKTLLSHSWRKGDNNLWICYNTIPSNHSKARNKIPPPKTSKGKELVMNTEILINSPIGEREVDGNIGQTIIDI